jgi:exodeoxyribonuclease V gamma subunit
VKIFRSNRLESLADALAQILVSAPDPDPFVAETIVVAGQGLGAWLMQALVDRIGIWAHPKFVFPDATLRGYLSLATGAKIEGKLEGWRPTSLRWRIARILKDSQQLAPESEVARLGARFGNDHAILSASEQIAEVFDRYQLLRPEILLQWEDGARAGGDDHLTPYTTGALGWQKELWQQLCAELGATHLARLVADFSESRGATSQSKWQGPSRLFVFGLSSMPPLYLEALQRIDGFADVFLFVPVPCREYWGESRTRREKVLNEGGEHPLLVGYGQLGADFLVALENLEGGYEDDVGTLFVEPVAQSVLGSLRGDLLANEARRSSGPRMPLQVEADDRSIVVYSCTSVMREVEVLHDVLLGTLRADPSLHPRDIVVYCPTLETYAPAITAIFRGASDDPTEPSLRARIVNRAGGAKRRVDSAFLALLRTMASRATVPDLLDALAHAPVLARYELDVEDVLGPLPRLLEKAGITWGLDPDWREREGANAAGGHSWLEGLARALLGYIAGDVGSLEWEHQPLIGRLQVMSPVSGEGMRLIASMAQFVDDLRKLARDIRAEKRPGQWLALALSIVETMMARVEEFETQTDDLVAALRSWAQEASDSQANVEVEFAWVCNEWARLLANGPNEHLTPQPEVAFFPLAPLRTVPAKVVVVLGMNEGVFPRNENVPTYAREVLRRRLGDHDRREEDRYHFLEILVSADERFIVLYTGFSQRDGSELAPATPVQDLIAVLEQGFVLPEHRRWVERMPLHAYSSLSDRSEAAVIVHSGAHARARARLGSKESPHLGLPHAALPLASIRSKEVLLSQLIRTMLAPSRAFLRQICGVEVPDDFSPDLAGRDPLGEKRNTAFTLDDAILRCLERGEDTSGVILRWSATGQAPAGQLGRTWAEERIRVCTRLFEQANALGSARSRRSADLDIHDWKIVLDDRDFIGDRHVFVRPHALSTKRLVSAWISHLAWSALEDNQRVDWNGTTEVWGVDRTKDVFFVVDQRFEAIEKFKAASWMADWIGAYERALLYPLPFFSELAHTLVTKKSEYEARKGWLPREEGRGEGQRPANQYLYGALDPTSPHYRTPLGDSFARLSEELLMPMVEHLEMVEESKKAKPKGGAKTPSKASDSASEKTPRTRRKA